MQESRAAGLMMFQSWTTLSMVPAARVHPSELNAAELYPSAAVPELLAAERFDWTRGTPFAAYASWWVGHAMSKAVSNATTSVRLPDHLRSSLGRLAAERRADPSASWEVLARRAGVDPAEAENLAPLLSPPLSLDASLSTDSDASLGNLLADRDAEEAMEEVLVAADAGRLTRAADRELTHRERRILDARYGLDGHDPRTLREVGEELGLTPQRVAQLEKGALGKLRAALGGVHGPL